MVLKTLVEAILRSQRDPNNLLQGQLLNTLKQDVFKDVTDAYSMSQPLVNKYPDLYKNSRSFVDFLFKLCHIHNEPEQTSNLDEELADLREKLQKEQEISKGYSKKIRELQNEICELKNYSPCNLKLAENELVELEKEILEKKKILRKTADEVAENESELEDIKKELKNIRRDVSKANASVLKGAEEEIRNKMCSLVQEVKSDLATQFALSNEKSEKIDLLLKRIQPENALAIPVSTSTQVDSISDRVFEKLQTHLHRVVTDHQIKEITGMFNIQQSFERMRSSMQNQPVAVMQPNVVNDLVDKLDKTQRELMGMSENLVQKVTTCLENQTPATHFVERMNTMEMRLLSKNTQEAQLDTPLLSYVKINFPTFGYSDGWEQKFIQKVEYYKQFEKAMKDMLKSWRHSHGLPAIPESGLDEYMNYVIGRLFEYNNKLERDLGLAAGKLQTIQAQMLEYPAPDNQMIAFNTMKSNIDQLQIELAETKKTVERLPYSRYEVTEVQSDGMALPSYPQPLALPSCPEPLALPALPLALPSADSQLQKDIDEMCRILNITPMEDWKNQILKGVEDLETRNSGLINALQDCRTEKDTLNTEKTNLNQTIARHDAEKENLIAQITSLSEEKGNLENALQRYQPDKEKLETEINDLNQTIDTKTAEISQLNTFLTQQASSSKDKAQLQDLQGIIEALEKNKTKLNKKIRDLNAKNQHGTNEYNKVFDENESLKKEKGQLQDLLTQCQSDKNVLENEKANLNRDITTYTKEKDNFLEQYKSLSKEKEQLEAELQNKDTSVKEKGHLNQNVAKLNGENKKLSKNNTQLIEENKKLQELLQNCQSQKDVLEKVTVSQDIAACIQENSKLNEQILQLVKQNQTFFEANQTWQTGYKDLETKLQDYNKKYDELKQKYKEAESKVIVIEKEGKRRRVVDNDGGSTVIEDKFIEDKLIEKTQFVSLFVAFIKIYLQMYYNYKLIPIKPLPDEILTKITTKLKLLEKLSSDLKPSMLLEILMTYVQFELGITENYDKWMDEIKKEVINPNDSMYQRLQRVKKYLEEHMNKLSQEHLKQMKMQ